MPMRALRKELSEPGSTLVADHPQPEVRGSDVSIEVILAGICGTDRHIFEWDAWARSRVSPPVTLGHEIFGRVAEVGDRVTRFAPGQRVSVEGHIGCGTCQPCRTGNGHICHAVDIIGIDMDGGFADLVRVPETNVWPVPSSVTDEVAALLDPLGNAVHTVMAADVSGRSVLVTGVGVIGLMATAVARAAGATTIVGVDVVESRRELALAMGADHVFDANDPDWVEQARKVTAGQGPEVVLEMSGNPAAISGALDALRNGGTAAMLGLPSDPVSIDLPNQLIFKGATLLGINGRRIYETWFQMEGLLHRGIDVTPVIGHEVPLEDFERAFELAASPESLKVLMRVSE